MPFIFNTFPISGTSGNFGDLDYLNNLNDSLSVKFKTHTGISQIRCTWNSAQRDNSRNERQDVFRDKADKEDSVDRLSKLAPETGASCYAWVLMTNHVQYSLTYSVSYLSSSRTFSLTIFFAQRVAARTMDSMRF